MSATRRQLRLLDRLAEGPRTAKQINSYERGALRETEKAGLIVCSGSPDYLWTIKTVDVNDDDDAKGGL